MTKTYEECLDEIAVRYNYKDWEQFLTDCADTFTKPTDEIFKAMRKAALLYGESKWNQACEEQRELCCSEYMKIDVYDHSNKFQTIDREMESIKNAPKPTFKP